MKSLIVSCIIAVSIVFGGIAHAEMTKTDLYWLSKNIYYEARGESFLGQVMIGFVTLCRLEDGRWGNSIKSVVTAPHQFSWYDKHKKAIPRNKKAWNIAKKAAWWAVFAFSAVDKHDILYYHNNTITPRWAKRLEKVVVLENHIFYEKKG